jgi:protein-S-isoprenylcysteine O-methyltransferase Ste14
MTLHAVLDFAGLAIGSVYATIPLYWLSVHALIGRWRSTGRAAYAALLPLWMVYALIFFGLGWRFRHVHLYISFVPWLPAMLFLFLGFALYQAGMQSFGRSKIVGLEELEPERHRQELVITGIRSKVRHPLYLGHFCELFGWTLGTGSLPLIAMLAFAVGTGALMIRQEDDELEQRFGEPFRRYRNRVPAFLPK